MYVCIYVGWGGGGERGGGGVAGREQLEEIQIVLEHPITTVDTR